jgi:hypothetical protein
MGTVLGEGREGNINLRLNSRGELITDQDVSYIVEADTRDQDELAVVTSTSDLPIPSVTLRGTRTCRSLRGTRRKENPLIWDFTANFSNEVQEDQNNKEGQSGGEDPTAWIPVAELEYESYEDMLREDVNGKRWINSAGDPFETGFNRTRHIAVRSFSQFELYKPGSSPAWQGSTAYKFNQYVTNDSLKTYRCVFAGTSASSGGPTGTGTSWIQDGTCYWEYQNSTGAISIDDLESRMDTVNSATFLGIAAGELLLVIRKATVGVWYGKRCWKIDYALKRKRDGWKIKMLNVGYRYKTGSTPAKALFLDGGVNYLGKLQADGTKVADEVADDPSVEEFDQYEELDFNNFLRIEQ